MDNVFKRISDGQSLEEILARSTNEPVVLFKHSLSCPLSAAAYEEMLGLGSEVVLVEVQRARELSSEIEKRTGVTHESPQVIVFRNGKAVWNASHFDVRADTVADALRQHQ